MNFAIYYLDTKQISRFVDCPSSQLEYQCNEGEEFYLNCPSDATHIINNEPVTIIPEVIPPTLDEIKIKARKNINKTRDNEELKSFEYLGKEFDADNISIKRISLAVQAAQVALLNNQTFSITWTCADNTTIDLTETQIVGMLQPMLLRGVELHEKARVLKSMIDAATTKEEVEAIVW